MIRGSGSSPNPTGVEASVPKAKWTKFRTIVRSDLAALRRDPEAMERPPLDSNRGVLNHLARTFAWINPYLKGYHLTLDSWRPYRAADGWKITGAELQAIMEDDEVEILDTEAPATVSAVPRFESDLEARTDGTWSPSSAIVAGSGICRAETLEQDQLRIRCCGSAFVEQILMPSGRENRRRVGLLLLL